MQVFAARQPIFDRRDRVAGYELLHRNGPQNRFSGADSVQATRELLSDNVLGDGSPFMLGNVPAWVNFPVELLLDGSATLAPTDRIVVELLEDIEPADEVVAACADLAARGYSLAADDVVDADDDNPLLDLVSMVKVDFRGTTGAERAALARRFSGKVTLLAEKVETRAEQQEAVDLGFALFQGYYLREPIMMSKRTLDRTTAGVLAILQAVAEEPIDFEKAERALKQDVALTDQLLRYLNSAVFSWRRQVTTLRAAMVTLGERQLRRWVSVAALSSLSVDKPDELLTSTLVRARMCEGLAPTLSGADPTDLFLTGLYSQLHLLVGADFRDTIEQAPLPEPIARALLDGAGPLWDALELVVAYERGLWEDVREGAGRLHAEPECLPAAYTAALEFADSLRGSAGASA